ASLGLRGRNLSHDGCLAPDDSSRWESHFADHNARGPLWFGSCLCSLPAAAIAGHRQSEPWSKSGAEGDSKSAQKWDLFPEKCPVNEPAQTVPEPVQSG